MLDDLNRNIIKTIPKDPKLELAHRLIEAEYNEIQRKVEFNKMKTEFNELKYELKTIIDQLNNTQDGDG